MSIDLNIGGWLSVKNKLRQVVRVANQVINARIQRSGTQDSISFSGDSLVINLKAREEAPAGVGAPGSIGGDIVIYLADESVKTLTNDEVFAGYESAVEANEGNPIPWSIEFEVGSYRIKEDFLQNPPVGSVETDLYDVYMSGDVQTYYRIPIIRQVGEDGDGNAIWANLNVGGAYRENIFCKGAIGPIVELVKIA